MDGVSMAEIVRRLIEQEASCAQRSGSVEDLWDIAGIAEDRGPQIDGVAVSENPELYLMGTTTGSRVKRRSTKRKRRP